jgi:hypothetical protein
MLAVLLVVKLLTCVAFLINQIAPRAQEKLSTARLVCVNQTRFVLELAARPLANQPPPTRNQRNADRPL